MASGGYPVSYKKGIEMFGLNDNGGVDGAIVYHAGTKYENGKFYTNGGRVLGVTATADTLDEIIDETLSAVSSERTTRVIDNEAAGSMERRKREGYF